MSIEIHNLADVQSPNIGDGTRIWQFSVILPGASIGSQCNICAHTFLENDVQVGNNVTIKCGVFLWDGTELRDNVFVGPNVTFVNDRYPRSRKYPTEFQRTVVYDGASIGANSTILGGLTIGTGAMVGAGSLVTKNVPKGELWYGAPAIYRGQTRDSDS